MGLLFTYFNVSKTVRNTKFPRCLMPLDAAHPTLKSRGCQISRGCQQTIKESLCLMYIMQFIKCYTENLFTLSQFNLPCTMRGYKIFLEWGHLTSRGSVLSRGLQTFQPKLLQKLHEMEGIHAPRDASYIHNS